MDITDLDYVLDTLNEAGFSGSEWKPLGLTLGLYHDTLEASEANHPGDEQGCLRECLTQWLKRADDGFARRRLTMTYLCDTLEKIGEIAAADYISKLLLY